MNTAACRQAATKLSRTWVSPAAAASLPWASTHQPQPLIWLARSITSAWVALGSGDWSIARLTLNIRLLIFAPSSLVSRSKRGSIASSSLVKVHWTSTRCR